MSNKIVRNKKKLSRLGRLIMAEVGKKKAWYIASPYTSNNEYEAIRIAIQVSRYNSVARYTKLLLENGVNSYSPIAYHHPIATKFGLPEGFSFYREFDLDMIERLDGLVVLCLTGWESSVGVREEIDKARELNLPVVFVDGGEGAWQGSICLLKG